MSDLKYPIPEGLAVAGSALWVGVASRYTLRPDELAILHSACRAADMVGALERAWSEEGNPAWTKGSMGQLVEHPSPKSIRSWQTTHDTALARLKLPDLDANEGVKPNQNRSAAQSKWAASHGKGA